MLATYFANLFFCSSNEWLRQHFHRQLFHLFRHERQAFEVGAHIELLIESYANHFPCSARLAKPQITSHCQWRFNFDDHRLTFKFQFSSENGSWMSSPSVEVSKAFYEQVIKILIERWDLDEFYKTSHSLSRMEKYLIRKFGDEIIELCPQINSHRIQSSEQLNENIFLFPKNTYCRAIWSRISEFVWNCAPFGPLSCYEYPLGKLRSQLL